MVRLLSMKKRLSFLEPIEDPCRNVIKKFKERRTKILKQSLSKLKKIPDAEQCLRQAVLIRNTFICAKDLSPKVFERQLLTRSPLQMEENCFLEEPHNNNIEIKESCTANAQELTSKDCSLLFEDLSNNVLSVLDDLSNKMESTVTMQSKQLLQTV